MSKGRIDPHLLERLSKADPLVKLVEDLDPAIDMLGTVYLALGNPEHRDMFSEDHCRMALLDAVEAVASARNKAQARVNEIWEASR